MTSTPRPPASLQSLGLLMLAACAVVVVAFLVAWLAYDPSRPSYGLHDEVAHPMMLTYGMVVVGTASGLIGMLLRTHVAIQSRPTPPIAIHGGVRFLRVLALSGPGVALAIIELLALTVIPSDGWKLWCGIGAGTWSLTTGLVFSKFMAQYTAEHPTTPTPAPAPAPAASA